MKDIKSDKVIVFLERVHDRRKKCTYKYGWMEGLRYCEQIQSILMFLWLLGAIDHPEYEKLCKKYKVRNKDIRRWIYTADFLIEELELDKL